MAQEGWEGLQQGGPAKVPIEVQQAQFELNKIIAKTFSSPNGKKCLEYMKQITIYKKTDGASFTLNGLPSQIARSAINNFVLDIMHKIKQAEAGPPKEGE